MKCISMILLAGLLLTSSGAMSAVSDKDFAQLRDELRALSQRLEELAAENAELRQKVGQETVSKENQVTPTVVGTSGGDNWADRIALKGDVRVRYENIDEDGKEDRNRMRVRARAALVADLANDVEVGIGVASGSTDPVSANQTLGDGGSSKDLNLDLAYFDWSGVDGLHVIGGKFKNFLVRPQKHALLWDGDWRPEGFGVTYENGLFFANAIGTWLESDSKDGNSEFSYGAQAGVNTALGSARIMVGASYFDFNTEGNTVFLGDTTDPGDFYGNTSTGVGCGTGGDCVYMFDYTLIQVFGDVGFVVAGMPLNIYFDFVNNTDPNSNDTGYAVGAKLGKVKSANDWQLQATYQDLEKDAVFGLLTDSDFGGGGTDSKGLIFKGGYGISKGWSLGVAYFINDKDESATKTDYNRLQLDTKFKFK